MLKLQGAKQDRETSFYSFPILVTTPWTASVFNKLRVSLRTELNPQRQFTELLTRDLPDLTPGSPELQLQTHTEGNTVSSAQTHTATQPQKTQNTSHTMKGLIVFSQHSLGNWFISPNLQFSESKCACFLSLGFLRAAEGWDLRAVEWN